MPNTKSQFATKLPYYASAVFLAYMPFHIFLVQSLSLLTGGLDVWKVAKDVVLAILVVFVICMVWRMGKANRLFKQLVFLTTVYGLLHVILWAVHPHLYRPSAILGLTYIFRVPCFAILGYGAALLWPPHLKTEIFMKLALAASTVVALFGIAQYFLPSGLLTHVGYSVARGVKPNFFIDNNPAFPRIMSTLRDPNSLGAYLILPLAISVFYGLRATVARRRLILGSLTLLYVVAIYFTYCRSAWIAAVWVVAALTALRFAQSLRKFLSRYWIVAALLLILAGVGGYSQRHNSHIDGVFSHTTNQQVGQYDSNQYHYLYVKQGIEGIAHQPLGHGPGTAGLASIQNPHGGRLTENYYVQVGYEVGIVGLLVFISINVLIYVQLWRHRSQPLAIILMVTFWGYVLINMLLQMWSNEAVTCQWWLLAGLAMAQKLSL